MSCGTENKGLAGLYGAHYFKTDHSHLYESPDVDLYSYKTYIGENSFTLSKGQSVVMVSKDKEFAIWESWRTLDKVRSEHMAVVFDGYQCGMKLASLMEKVNLPYVNGCASKQIFAPERVGDPTLQQLTIPPYTSEQMHHIHPTSRVVYVLKGRGYSIVGQTGKDEETELVEGMVCILDPMSPHHFRTEDEYLTVLPVHIFSSGPANIDKNHPMFNGTKEV